MLQRAGTRVVNHPRGLREANEKLYIFNFPEFVAPTRVTRSLAELREFLARLGGEMIVKPLDGCGGAGVFHVRSSDRNTHSILEMASDCGRRLVMAQKYLPEVRQGDKRILLLDGEPIGAVLRVPRADETRGNLHVGGTATKTALTARERQICAAARAPAARRRAVVRRHRCHWRLAHRGQRHLADRRARDQSARRREAGRAHRRLV